MRQQASNIAAPHPTYQDRPAKRVIDQAGGYQYAQSRQAQNIRTQKVPLGPVSSIHWSEEAAADWQLSWSSSL